MKCALIAPRLDSDDAATRKVEATINMLVRGFRILGSAAAGALLCLAASAFAQDYPSRPIRLIVPASAGGGTDVLGRMVAEGIRKHLGQPVVVEFRGGASGMIGADTVLAAPHDGYTLLMSYASMLTINPAIYKKISYDPVKDFVPVAFFVDVPNALVVHPSVPANTVAELIALVKAQPGKFNYASSGTATSTHLGMERFSQMAGLKMTHVPYKGGGPAMIDLMGGVVQLYINNLVEVLPQVKAGRVRMLAIASAKRSSVVPEIPTVAESGLPGFESTLWYGVMAAAGTPAAIVNKLNEAVRQTQQEPEVRTRLATMGAETAYYTPDEFGALIRREVELWGRVVREAGITPN
jgi:tripartite-type tricarboxylate transporter receptor subunit TctC